MTMSLSHGILLTSLNNDIISGMHHKRTFIVDGIYLVWTWFCKPKDNEEKIVSGKIAVKTTVFID
jgi:hypothetical protein